MHPETRSPDAGPPRALARDRAAPGPRTTPLSLAPAPEGLLGPTHGPPVVLINPDAARVRRIGVRGVVARVVQHLGPVAVDVAPGQNFAAALQRSLATRPRYLAVIGGDGTARTALLAARSAGAPVAPLPGGTLNRLSHAVYGSNDLETCLRAMARAGPRVVPAGLVADTAFFVVSGYGPLMDWNRMREAWRHSGVAASLREARVARQTLACPANLKIDAAARSVNLILAGLGPLDATFGLAPPAARTTLEVAGAHIGGLAPLAALGAAAAIGSWRRNRAVTAYSAASVSIEGPQSGVSALLDGEPVVLPSRFCVSFAPDYGLVWAPAAPEPRPWPPSRT